MWWWTVAKFTAKDIWDSLPGPWWVKLLLIIITQAIPGPQDEIILFAIIMAVRWYKKRKLCTQLT